MTRKIKCMVEECQFNTGFCCDAGEIEVCSCGTQNVKCSDQTACRTFRERCDCK